MGPDTMNTVLIPLKNFLKNHTEMWVEEYILEGVKGAMAEVCKVKYNYWKFYIGSCLS